MNRGAMLDAEREPRASIDRVHAEAWRRIGAPGTWWTGAERVAIAAEARFAARCALCRARKASLSPEAPQGAHERGSDLPLPEAAIEAVHRIATDPGRLSRNWYERLRRAGLDDDKYVELVAVASRTIALDVYQRALGEPEPPLPEALAGEPSRQRPEGVADGGAWVPLLPPARARGPEADLYPSKDVPNVIRALSLVPDEVRELLRIGAVQYVGFNILDLYYDMVLERPQIELLASRVSVLNQCLY